MKKTKKYFLCGALSVMLASTLLAEQVLRIGSAEEGVTVSTSATFKDVTGQFDTSALRAENMNSTVMTSDGVSKTYETRTVIVSLKQDNLIDKATENGETVASYMGSFSGKVATEIIRSQQDAVLSAISQKGIEYTLERRYNTVLNGFAIEVHTSHVSTIKKLAGVESVVIANSYTVPETITTSSSASDITNETSVYGTGIYDTSAYTNVNGSENDYGEGTVVAILDTGLDYTHPAYMRAPENYAWDKGTVEQKLLHRELTAETHGELDVNDVYVSEKVPFAFDYADKDPDVYPSYSNHGTHVAGIIGGYDASGYTDKDGNPITNTAFRGVVPDAQLVICKVFTDDLDDKDLGGAEAEDIIAALNDCVMLGVDVINMSLGTSCGFTTTNDGDDEGELLNKVYDDIKTAGISLVCAASNDFSSGYGGAFGTNLISNPDSSTVGSPSTFAAALSVASISGQKFPYMTATNKDGEEVAVFYEESRDKNSNPFDFAKQLLGDNTRGEFTFVTVPNTGRAQDYTSTTKRLLKAEGFQIALVKRGDNTFQDKLEVATANGAEAIIVYNNVAGIIRMNLGEVEDPIPAVSIDLDSGLQLLAMAGGVNKTYKITVDKDLKAGPFMSDFSSWGPTHDLKIKPEITAHGGEITSTVPGGYGEQSGTSMASPNMAGVMALVRNYIKSNDALNGQNLTPVEINRLANQLIMSTATTARDTAGRVYSPRKQGAGLGSLDNVITKTNAYLSVNNAENDYRPKIELKDGYKADSAYEMSFEITNFGTETLYFTPELICVTETIAKDGIAVAEQAQTLTTSGAGGSLAWSGNAINSNGKVEVGKGETKTVSVRFVLDEESIEKLEKFPNGMYVEGFLQLHSEDEDQCDLSLPYLAFYGDWEQAPMLDYTAYEIAASEEDKSVLEADKLKARVWGTQPFATYYNETYIIPMGGYVYLLDENDEQMYAKEEYASVSRYNDYYPDEEERSYMTTTAIKAVYAGLFRNARVVYYTLTDVRTGEVLLKDKCDRVGKSYAGGGSAVPSNVEINLSPEEQGLLAGGQYRLDFEFYINNPSIYTDFDGANPNNAKDEYSFTFTVDYDAPVLEDVRVRYYDYKEGTKEKQRIYLDIDVYDNHYAQAMMLCYPTIAKNGDTVLNLCTEYPTPIRNPKKNGTTTVTIEITDIYEQYGNQLYLQVDDYALNSCLYQLNITQAQAGLLPKDGSFELADGEDEITLGLYETHKVALVYSGDANLSNFGWRAINPMVADVKNGEIVGLKAGTTDIIVHDHKGNTRRIKVTVTNEQVGKLAPVPSFTFGAIETDKKWLTKANGFIDVAPGKTFTLEPSAEPWYHPLTGISFVWSSSNEKVAKVSQTGEVQTLRKGTATITAKVWRDGKETQYGASVTLSVVNEFEANNYTLQSYNGIGYNGEICPTCGRSWEYEELLDKKFCPECKTTEIIENDGVGVTVLKIPTKLNVMNIGEDVFKDNDNIERIVIPSTVININETAFENATALKEVYFVSTLHRDVDGDGYPENVDIDYADLSLINERAFIGCTALEKVDLTNVKTITIARECFAGCTALKEIIDMPSIGTAHHYAFAGCTSLGTTGVLDLSGLYVTGTNVFDGCTGIKSVQTGKFTSIGTYMFNGCTGLKEITLSSAIVESGAFYGCTNLEKVSFVSADTLEIEIGANAFENCGKNLTGKNFTIDFGDEIVRVIGSNAFIGSSLNQFTFTEGLQVLGENAFKNTQLSVITIEELDVSNLQILGVPFDGITVSVSSTSDKYFEDNDIIYEILDSSTVKLVYANTTVNDDITIPEKVNGYYVESIGAYAFAGSTITSLNASYVSSIGKGAFENSKVQTVTLGNITEIPEKAFYNSSLQTFNNATVEKVGDYAFAGSALTSFNLANATEFGNSVFANCLTLQKVEDSSFADKPLTFGSNVFSGCKALTEVYISPVASMGYGTFRGATALKKVVFADGTVDLGTYTFVGSPVETVEFGSQVTAIGDGVFYGCKNLKNVSLQGVKTIGAYAFSGCESLSYLDLGSVRNKVNDKGDKVLAPAIGNSAFSGCINLTQVVMPIGLGNTLVEQLIIDTNAFADCSKLSIVHFDSVAEIGSYAFSNTGFITVDLEQVQTLGNGVFAGSKALKTIVADANDNYFVEDGVLYRYIDKEGGRYALNTYPAGLVIDENADGKRVYNVKEGAIRVDAYAFYGLKENALDEIVLPYSITAIGDSAFFASGVKEYTFECINAPTLETYYRAEVQQYIESLETDLTTANYKGYYNTNFEEYILNFSKYGTKQSNLIMNYPENGVGYDNHTYTTYFATRNTTGVHMSDTTRLCKDEIADMPDAETVAGWKSFPTTAENKAMVETFAEKVKQAHIAYNSISNDEKQLALLGEESIEKLSAIEEELRQVKKHFNISVKVQSAETSKASTHKNVYLVGEKFDMTGLLVTVTYDDFSTEEVDASRLTLKEDKTLTKLDQYVQVVYRDGGVSKTAFVMISVVDSMPKPEEQPQEPTAPVEESDGSPVGLIIGISCGVVAVIGAVAFVVLRKKAKKSVNEPVDTTDENKNE